MTETQIGRAIDHSDRLVGNQAQESLDDAEVDALARLINAADDVVGQAGKILNAMTDNSGRLVGGPLVHLVLLIQIYQESRIKLDDAARKGPRYSQG